MNLMPPSEHFVANMFDIMAIEGFRLNFRDLCLLRKLRKYCIFSQHSSKMISFKGVSGPLRNGFVHNIQFPDIRRALTFANTFKAEKMAELKELDEF